MKNLSWPEAKTVAIVHLMGAFSQRTSLFVVLCSIALVPTFSPIQLAFLYNDLGSNLYAGSYHRKTASEKMSIKANARYAKWADELRDDTFDVDATKVKNKMHAIHQKAEKLLEYHARIFEVSKISGEDTESLMDRIYQFKSETVFCSDG